MEVKKLMFGLFIGVPVGLTVALIFTPLFWWLGIIAGFCACYIFYDLIEIKEKAPIAWKNTKEKISDLIDWLKKPHPFLVSFILVTLLSIYPSIRISYRLFPDKIEANSAIIAWPIISGLLSVVISFVLLGIACDEKKICFINCDIYNSWNSKGFKKISFTYKKFFSLAIEELFLCLSAILKFFLYKFWIIFLPKFIYKLIKLIHSKERVICGLDGALAVYITYNLVTVKTSTEFIILLTFGALIGAGIGTIHYKLAGLFKLTPAVN